MSPTSPPVGRRHCARLLAGGAVTLFALTAPPPASASLLSPELEDKLATILALVVLFVVPVVLIVLFWMVHILPEQIAHKRHHPQLDAIRTLCLLSLVFGGLLWPLAWIWAYSKPVLHKLAYGTDKHPDYYRHAGEESGMLPDGRGLGERLARLEGRSIPAAELAVLRADVEALEARFPESEIR